MPKGQAGKNQRPEVYFGPGSKEQDFKKRDLSFAQQWDDADQQYQYQNHRH